MARHPALTRGVWWQGPTPESRRTVRKGAHLLAIDDRQRRTRVTGTHTEEAEMSDSKQVRERELVKQNDVMRAALVQFANCDLNEFNCASLAVATKRIQNIARTALASCAPAKGDAP